MPKHRIIPKPRHYYEQYLTLKGRLVLFTALIMGHKRNRPPYEIIFRVLSFSRTYKNQVRIYGDFIAGTGYWTSYLQSGKITSYRILTVRDLPLYIGYKHKSPLFDELLKGEADYGTE